MTKQLELLRKQVKDEIDYYKNRIKRLNELIINNKEVINNLQNRIKFLEDDLNKSEDAFYKFSKI